MEVVIRSVAVKRIRYRQKHSRKMNLLYKEVKHYFKTKQLRNDKQKMNLN